MSCPFETVSPCVSKASPEHKMLPTQYQDMAYNSNCFFIGKLRQYIIVSPLQLVCIICVFSVLLCDTIVCLADLWVFQNPDCGTCFTWSFEWFPLPCAKNFIFFSILFGFIFIFFPSFLQWLHSSLIHSLCMTFLTLQIFLYVMFLQHLSNFDKPHSSIKLQVFYDFQLNFLSAILGCACF